MIYAEITGRLGADSEIKTSRNGSSKFLSMRIATNDYVNGENVTTWVSVMCSSERALKMVDYLKKGNLVSVRGTLRASIYDRNGDKTVSIDIFADRVDFVGGNSSASTQTNDSVQQQPKQAEAPTEQPRMEQIPTPIAAVEQTDDDDLPF